MSEKIRALDLTREEWIAWLESELSQPKFRADQICQWLWQKHTFDVDEMTNLSLPLRELLAQRVEFSAPLLVKEQRSKLDGTRKYLWRLADGETVESVLLKQGDRLTACISTQVGCPLQCSFCATGLSGFVRNLTAGEIAGQFLAMEKILGCDLNNLVFMGMGEPFLNTESVLRSVRLLNDPHMRGLGIRHITVSTSGVAPGIQALADSGLGVRLAVSLHAANNDLRSTLMPVNRTYPLEELREAMTSYQKKTGDRISIEYALFGGVNDSVERARELVRFLKGIHVYVNLIPCNQVDGRYEKPRPEDILRFRSVLETAGFECELRQEQGADIDAACGQLRRKTSDGQACELEVKPSAHFRTAAREKTHAAPDRRPYRGRMDGGKPSFDKSQPRGEAKPGADKSYHRDDRQADGFSARRDDKYRRSEAKTTGERDFHGAAHRERTGGRPSGGFVEERGPRGKTARPEKERYRSGKMKESRPSYRGQGAETENEHRGYKPRAPRIPGLTQETDKRTPGPRRETKSAHENNGRRREEQGRDDFRGRSDRQPRKSSPRPSGSTAGKAARRPPARSKRTAEK